MIGALLFVLLGTNFSRRALAARSIDGERAPLSPLRVLVFGSLLTILLYPPALRVSNALPLGIDFGIVTRYSMAFAPLLVLLVLVLVRQTRFQAVGAVLGAIGLLATAGVAL